MLEFNFRLIVLLLIRKSITSLRKNLQRVTDRLPLYHDDDLLSTNSATSPVTNGAKEKEGGAPASADGMVGHRSSTPPRPPEPEVVL